MTGQSLRQRSGTFDAMEISNIIFSNFEVSLPLAPIFTAAVRLSIFCSKAGSLRSFLGLQTSHARTVLTLHQNDGVVLRFLKCSLLESTVCYLRKKL